MTAHDKILDRARKLLRLAGSANLHEAASAAARAQELLDRHRIDDAVRRRLLDGAGDLAAMVDGRDRPLESSVRLRAWKSFLASHLAPLNDCRIYTLHDPPPQRLRHLIPVGHRDDVDALAAMYAFLVTQIECLTRKHGQGQDRRWCDGFRLGAVGTVVRRLRDSRQAALEASPDEVTPASTSLSVRSEALAARLIEVDAWIESGLGPSLKRGRGRRLRGDHEGFLAGEVAGLTVPLGETE